MRLEESFENKSWGQAVAYCKGILEKFRPRHKRIKVFIGFEVEPAIWRGCPHCENPEEALEQAKRADIIEGKFKKKG